MSVNWTGFWKTLLYATVGLGAVVYAAIVLIDPYDTVFFAPDVERAPVSTNQRFSFPALARKARFDSAVIGTSTTRLLRPERLNTLLDASFVNLSLNSGTAYEQRELLRLFARHHPNARYLIVGIDNVWCHSGPPSARFTERPFPTWMYDENRWNDLLYLFNPKSLEQLGRQLQFMLGLPGKRYGQDGYKDFLPPEDTYDLNRARNHIYGTPEPKPVKPADPPFVPSPAEPESWHFPALPLLADMLEALPQPTRKVLLFVPYHRYLQPPPRSRQAAVLDECKRRIAALAHDVRNTVVMDFMIPSSLTRRDENYWDPLHYTVTVADELAGLISEGLRSQRGRYDLFRYLEP